MRISIRADPFAGWFFLRNPLERWMITRGTRTFWKTCKKLLNMDWTPQCMICVVLGSASAWNQLMKCIRLFLTAIHVFFHLQEANQPLSLKNHWEFPIAKLEDTGRYVCWLDHPQDSILESKSSYCRNIETTP